MTTVWMIVISTFIWAGDEVHVRIPAKDFVVRLEKTEGATIIDLRTPKEHAGGHLENCKLLDYLSDDFEERLKKLPKNETYFIYCRSGGRSGRALTLMEKLGFTRVYEMSDGILGWQKAGLPLVKPEKE